jgi:hypothetical protein
MSHLKSPVIQLASKLGDELKVTWKLNQDLYTFTFSKEFVNVTTTVFCDGRRVVL